jgi:ribosomal protein S18 acetylase RimI-like enzyme
VNAPSIELVAAALPADVERARALFRDYADGLGVDLCFQGFEAELAALPGEYAAPRGILLLALVDGAAAGCCALRPREIPEHPNACEMKRLYVRQAFRGLGLGRRLAEAVLSRAREAGYACILLDTLDDMHSARLLYGKLGFREVPPYYPSPIAATHYLKADLLPNFK